jgi:hypothetical protein
MATVGVMHRIHVEERALLKDLGDRDRDHAAPPTPLLPFTC